MKIIYIAGSSCTGKSTIGAHLSAKLNAFFIPTDVIKYTIRSKEMDKNDIIFSNTFSAYLNHSDYTPKNMYRYAIKHSEEIINSLKYINDYFSRVYKYVVVEGALLIPELLIKNKLINSNTYYFLLSLNRNRHLSRLQERSLSETTHNRYREILDFQILLEKSSKKISKHCLINSAVVSDAVDEIIQKIIND